MISNCSGDERGKLRGGKAGDQTKREYRVRTWYNRPWNHVLRPPTRQVGERLADNSEKAAKNDNIGYNQDQRLTYFNELENANWHPEDITKPCETDCSESTAANAIATGYQLGIKKLKELSPKLYSGNIRKALVNAGFKDLTAKKYLTSDDYLLPGDVLLYEGHHVAINLTKGSKAGEEKYPEDTPEPAPKKKKGYSGAFPELPPRGYYKQGDGYKEYTEYKAQIKRIQRFLNWALDKELAVDGKYGAKTATAVSAFQKKVGITVDTRYGKQTLAAAKAFKE